MKFFKKFKIEKAVEEVISPVNNNEAVVTLKEVKERKHRLLFVFEEENNSTSFWIIHEKDEEELKKLFQTLTEAHYQEEYKAEKEVYDSEIKAIEAEDIKEDKKEAKKTKKKQPLTPHERFKNADLDDTDLIGKELKVYALEAIKGGKTVRLIQSWQEVV